MTHEQRKISAMYLKSTELLKEDLTKKDEERQRAGHRKQSIGAAGGSTSAVESATKMRNLMF